MIGPAWSLGLPSFPPLFPGSVLCLKLNFCFLPKWMMEREKKKKPPRVEKWLLLTADFLPWPRRQCPQLTPGRQALCKWEAVSMSAHLRLSSRKEREKKKKTTDIVNKKTPRPINSSWLQPSWGAGEETSCFAIEAVTYMPGTSLVKEIGGDKGFTTLAGWFF